METGFESSPRELRLVTAVNTGEFTSPYLPVPYAPEAVNGLTGRWSWDPATLSIKGVDTNSRDQQYVVLSVAPQLTPDLLARASAPVQGVPEEFIRPPANVPDIVRTTAESVTAGSSTAYAKAMAIQKYLRSAEFTYSLQSPVQGGYDGNGLSVLADFLDPEERLLHPLRLGHGRDGPAGGHPQPDRRRLRPGPADRRHGVHRRPGCAAGVRGGRPGRPCLAGTVLPGLGLGAVRADALARRGSVLRHGSAGAQRRQHQRKQRWPAPGNSATPRRCRSAAPLPLPGAADPGGRGKPGAAGALFRRCPAAPRPAAGVPAHGADAHGAAAG